MGLLESYEGQLPVQFVERMQTAIEEENHGAENIDEICVLRAFQDALGWMFTRGGELWLDNIPNDAPKGFERLPQGILR